MNWQCVRASYLTWLKAKLAQQNRLVFQDGTNFIADTFARLLRATEQPAPLDLVTLAFDCEQALAYDVEKIDDGRWWQRADTAAFIELFSQSIRECYRHFGDDFVLYVRRFDLADCYRSQRDDETQHDYDTAWLNGWTRFIELADSYGEHAAAQRVLDGLQRMVQL